ncbi:MAG: hypothetical protein EP298_11875 [Gammaproteobacteria bacterium]|nr:MAG: hypothetical protein EP298_11875 [Gammaproteobacteria bacterium]UTW42048.1 hypothetical protein KFE69_11145 [bacterium SCSIO 12844]
MIAIDEVTNNVSSDVDNNQNISTFGQFILGLGKQIVKDGNAENIIFCDMPDIDMEFKKKILEIIINYDIEGKKPLNEDDSKLFAKYLDMKVKNYLKFEYF